MPKLPRSRQNDNNINNINQQDTPTPTQAPPPPAATQPPPPPPPPTAAEYFFGKEGEFDADLAYIGINRRRLVLNVAVATTLALGADFLGVTSKILSSTTTPEQMDDLKLDVLYPVRGFKRFIDEDDGYEFRYPKAWLADQAVLLAETQSRTQARSPLPPPQDPLRFSPTDAQQAFKITNTRTRTRPGAGVRPDAALGPPGGNQEENVSVVKSKVMAGFSLEGTLGPPQQAAETLLATAIAPPGSGKNTTLISATAQERAPGGLVYQLEYVVKKETKYTNFELHSLSVIAARPEEDTLFTLTVLAPERVWKEREVELREVARSFRLTR